MPLATAVLFLLPRWFFLPVARLAGRLVYRFNRRQRRRLLDNYRHILGPDAPPGLAERTARQAFVNLATGYLDLLRVPVLRRNVVKLGDLAPGTLENLDRVLGEGRAAVLVTAHVGNWDLAGAFLAAHGYPLSAVVEPVPAGWARTFNRYRCATELEAIPIPDHRAIARAIERNRLLVLVADRDLTGRGVACPAFDARRSFPRGPATYALRHDLSVVLGYFLFQDRPGRPPYLGCVEPPFDFRPTGSADRDIEEFTNLIARALNRLIARFPDQWLVFRAGWQ